MLTTGITQTDKWTDGQRGMLKSIQNNDSDAVKAGSILNTSGCYIRAHNFNMFCTASGVG